MSGVVWSYFFFDAPSGIECCVYAKNPSQAAKALLTTGNTLAARGKRFNDVETALPYFRPGLRLASENPGAVVVRQASGGWELLVDDPESVLLTDKQRQLKKMTNAQIGAAPMKQRSVSCDDETWGQFLELGGARWFRATVKSAYASKAKR